MKKNKALNKFLVFLKKFILGGSILAILTCIFYFSNIFDRIQSHSVDFDIYTVIDNEADVVEYKFKKVSDDFNKNYKANLYYMIEFPVDGEIKSSVIAAYDTSIIDIDGNQLLCFTCPYSFMEKSFSQMASITHYMDKNSDEQPKINAYLNVYYSTKKLDIKRNIWYCIEDGNITHYYPTHKFKETINNYDPNFDNSILSIYCKYNNNVDLQYISTNITICNSYDELISLINESENRELTDLEKNNLKKEFINNGNVLN